MRARLQARTSRAPTRRRGAIGVVKALCVLGLAMLGGPLQAPAATNNLAAGIAQFGAGYEAWDGAGLAQAAATLAKVCAAEPASVTNHYWHGVAAFHLHLFHVGEPANPTNRQQAADSLGQAIQTLSRAVSLDATHAESHALLSTAYGLSVGLQPARAFWLGKRIMDHEKQARQLAPDNPRVLYLAGMSRFYGPAMLGGKKAALELLLAAEKQFAVEASQPAAPMSPLWGRVNNLVYAAKTHHALGQRSAAAACLQQALGLSPTDKLALAEREKIKP